MDVKIQQQVASVQVGPDASAQVNVQPQAATVVINTGRGSTAGIVDGDYGDVKVSGAGSVMRVEGASPPDGEFRVIPTNPAVAALLTLMSAVGLTTAFRIMVNGLLKWDFGSGTTGTFFLGRYDDTGAFLDNVMTVSDDTGVVSFAHDINVTGLVNASNVNTGASLITDTDVSLGANSDLKVATQKAIKAYADAIRLPRVQAVVSAATVTPTFSNDLVKITAQAVALALANPTGTVVPGAGLVIRIKDNGTSRAITYDTQYRAIGVTLPTATVAGKILYLGLIYNADDTKWDVVSVLQET